MAQQEAAVTFFESARRRTSASWASSRTSGCIFATAGASTSTSPRRGTPRTPTSRAGNLRGQPDARAMLAINAIRARFEVDPEVERVFGSHLIHAVGRLLRRLPPDGASMIPDRADPRQLRVPPASSTADVLPHDRHGARRPARGRSPRSTSRSWRQSKVVVLHPGHVAGVGWWSIGPGGDRRARADHPPLGSLGDTASFGDMVPDGDFSPGRERSSRPTSGSTSRTSTPR